MLLTPATCDLLRCWLCTDQNKLHWLCKYVLNTIIKGLSTMPFGMRWLAKQLAEYVLLSLGPKKSQSSHRTKPSR